MSSGALVTGQRDDFDCPDNFGFYPHYRSCDKYWACENGTATLKVCGNGLVFDDADPLRENCAYPFSVNCGDRTDLGEFFDFLFSFSHIFLCLFLHAQTSTSSRAQALEVIKIVTMCCCFFFFSFTQAKHTVEQYTSFRFLG